MTKGIIKRVYLSSDSGRFTRLNLSLRKRAVNIEEVRQILEKKYKSKVLFVYESI